MTAGRDSIYLDAIPHVDHLIIAHPRSPCVCDKEVDKRIPDSMFIGHKVI